MSGRAPILLLAAALFCACCVASFLLLRLDERIRRAEARREAALAPYRATAISVSSLATLAGARRASGWLARVQRWIGIDAGRPVPYPVPAWVVLTVAVLPPILLAWLLRGLLHGFAGALVPVGWVIVVRAYYRGADARRRGVLFRQLPDALGVVVRAVRIGIPVAEAIRAVSRDASEPTASEFARVADQVSIGTPLDEALRDLAARNQLAEYRFFATAMSLQGQTGGGISETLENLADVIRKRVALKARGFALAAEARTSAGVLAVLPIFAGLALAVLSPSYIAPLFEDGPGQTMFGVGVVWLGLGLLAMRGMIRKSLS